MIRTPKGPRRTARQAILDTAAVVLADSPGASMSEVAKAAGVGRATLYRHFPSREALVEELSLEAIRVTDEAVSPIFADYSSAAEALEQMLLAMIPLGDRFHFLANEPTLDADSEAASQTRRQLDDLAQFVEQAKTEGLFAAELPTAWISAAIDSLIWTAWNSVHRGEVAPRDAARFVYRTLVNGLGPEKG